MILRFSVGARRHLRTVISYLICACRQEAAFVDFSIDGDFGIFCRRQEAPLNVVSCECACRQEAAFVDFSIDGDFEIFCRRQEAPLNGHFLFNMCMPPGGGFR